MLERISGPTESNESTAKNKKLVFQRRKYGMDDESDDDDSDLI
jgi:hypothetical protein